MDIQKINNFTAKNHFRDVTKMIESILKPMISYE